MQSADVTPVLISGGGPVGLALAIELGMSGIACTLVERRDGSVTLPKMSSLSIRGMEISRRLGVADAVRSIGWPHHLPNDMCYCTSLVGYELARERIPSYDESEVPYSPERPTPCAQIYYDPILLARARELPQVTLHHDTALEDFRRRDGLVHALVRERTTGRTRTIIARYLVGCDGADGAVVSALGFDYEGFGLVAHSLNVFFRAPHLMELHDKGTSRFFRFLDARGPWGEIIGIDGKELWRLSVLRAEHGLDGDAYVRRLAGTDTDYELLSVLPWERRERVATRYRDAQVFICGDAAHQLSPTGGLGLHTGLGDALDLGWKLAAVLHGWGGEALLDSYALERRPLALENGRVSTDLFNAFAEMPYCSAIIDDTADGAAARREFAAAFERSHAYRNPLHNDNLRLGYCYEPSPICIPDGSARPAKDSRTFANVARPGTRAPHAWLRDGRSTLDLFGPFFVLLRFGERPPSAEALVAAATARGVPLRVVDIADPQIAALYERRLVLVRPDGHVAWRGDALTIDAPVLIDQVRGSSAVAVG